MYKIVSNSDIDEFILSLEKKSVAKVIRTVELLEEFGSNIGMPHSKKVERCIFELRIHGDQAVRIFYTFHKDSIVLLHAYIKKSQKIPLKELLVVRKNLGLLTRHNV